MDKAQVVASCEAAQQGQHEVSDDVARQIASWFHTGTDGPFYKFYNTGAYDRSAMYEEMRQVINSHYRNRPSDERLMMDMLGTYILNRKD